MSGLEKFQASESWRTNFKKFLFMQRKPEIVQNTTIIESQRYSLDIGEDLKTIIEEKKNLKGNPKTVQINSKEEIIDKMDDSFEALESMCNKTASDPNSTLFHYLHSDRKEQVLAEVKKRSAERQIFNAHNEEEQLFTKINNCTLLDDIEAPSRIWDNTICDQTILQTSPVKMVGLLRPSTIVEETPDDSTNSDISSHLSFRTTSKSGQSDVSSSAYDTAQDCTVANNEIDLLGIYRTENPEKIMIDETVINSFPEILKTNEVITLGNKSEDEIDFNSSDISVDLIDLDKTVSENKEGKNKFTENEFDLENKHNVSDNSVIEIISDEEDDKFEVIEVHKMNNIKSEIISNSDDINHGTYSINESHENDKENYVETHDIKHGQYSFNESHENKENFVETHEQSRKSMQFNDTMEEVEYLLKKGMEYIDAENASRKNPEKIKLSELSACNNNKTQPNSPMKHSKTLMISTSPNSKAKSWNQKTPITKGHGLSSKRFDIDIRPFPKLDIFATPRFQGCSKDLTNKQQKFSHIISPIGTYMKKTAKTPLMSSINCKTKDYFNSTAILELENESRMYQPQFSTDLNGSATGCLKLPSLISEAKRPLPKKAYISSDLKHIVDERTPVTIPGSKKIQKYLENAMMPAVLRHDGKFKVPSGITNKINSPSSGSSSKLPLKVSDANSTIPHRNNASLADLSVMSGDVSMYTIMDAQKF